ncbi:hypothetical protein P1X14_07265 [Sphingomonas sp. AOB5]|uniref:surface-adhesin E family protein n=1 Tax=Sphingomonas sp. AOB5 TaxID=3034017 RepID=UPI0023F6A921|nr:surface-adhesin E family protein [Sphingomonas sp. AOB5]MDF7775039.1 hypothetical protein [Sphingomonas sp. AOB5]
MRVKAMMAAAALLAAPAAMAQASDWRSVDEFGSGDRQSMMFVDAASVKRPSATTREVMVMSHFMVARQFTSGQRYTAIRISYRIDCSANTFQTFKSTAYLEEQPLFSSDTLTPAAPINEGTIVGRVAPMACSGNFSSVPKITSATPNLEGKRIFGQ